VRAIAVAALLAACASSRPPAIRNVEPARPPAPEPMRCQSPWVQPAMWCSGGGVVVFNGCRWVCVWLEQ